MDSLIPEDRKEAGHLFKGSICSVVGVGLDFAGMR